MNHRRYAHALVALSLVAAAATLGSACSSDENNPATGAGGSGGASEGGDDGGTCTGGPVMGAANMHCMSDAGPIKQVTDMAVCSEDAGADDGGAAEDDAGGGSDFGETNYGTSADDDDCKYHVTYTMTPICVDKDVTVTVTVTKTADGLPATGAAPSLDYTIPPADGGGTHVGSSNPDAVESPAGTYTFTGVQFDRAGRWNFRFHFYETCPDGETSPHGHVAFWVDVP